MIRFRQNVQVPAASAPLMIGPLYGLRIRRRDAYNGSVVVVECQNLAGQVLDPIVLGPDEDGWQSFVGGLRRVRIYTRVDALMTSGPATVDLFWATTEWEEVGQRSRRDVPLLHAGGSESVPGAGLTITAGTQSNQQITSSQVTIWLLNPDAAARTFSILGYIGSANFVLGGSWGFTIPANGEAWVTLGHGARPLTPAPASVNLYTLPMVVPGRIDVVVNASIGVVNAAIGVMWGRQ